MYSVNTQHCVYIIFFFLDTKIFVIQICLCQTVLDHILPPTGLNVLSPVMLSALLRSKMWSYAKIVQLLTPDHGKFMF